MRRRFVVTAAVFVLALAGVALALTYYQDGEIEAAERELVRISNAQQHVAFSGTFVFSTSGQPGKFEIRMQAAYWGDGKSHFMFKGFRLNDGDWFDISKWSGDWSKNQGQDWSKAWGKGWQQWGGNWQNQRSEWMSYASAWNKRNWNFTIFDPALAASNYRLTRFEGGIVAGRPSVGWNISPRHHGQKPSFKLWVDGETSFPLVAESFDSRSNLVSRFAYESITFEKPREPGTVHSETHGQELSLSDLRANPPFALWIPEYTPKGYRFLKALHARWGSAQSVQLLYTDGLTVISVIQYPKGQGWWRRGPGDAPEISTNQTGKPVVARSRMHGMEMLKVTLGNSTLTLTGWNVQEELTTVITSMTEFRAKEK